MDDAPRLTTNPRRRSLTLDLDGDSLYIEVLGEGGTPLILNTGLGGNHADRTQNLPRPTFSPSVSLNRRVRRAEADPSLSSPHHEPVEEG